MARRLPRSVIEYSNQLAADIVRKPLTCDEHFERVRPTLARAISEGCFKDPSERVEDLDVLADQVIFQASVVGFRTIVIYDAYEKMQRARTKNSGSFAWQFKLSDPQWHVWSRSPRRTYEPFTSFAKGVLDWTDRSVDALARLPHMQQIVPKAADAMAAEAARRGEPFDHRDPIGELKQGLQSNVLAMTLTSGTIHFLEQQGSLPNGCLDPEGLALLRIAMTLAAMSADQSGHFHRRFALDDFIPQDNGPPEIWTHPIPDESCTREWRGHEVFVSRLNDEANDELETDTPAPLVTVAPECLAAVGVRKCPALGVSTNGLIQPNPIIALARFVSMYDSGIPLEPVHASNPPHTIALSLNPIA